MDLYRRDRQRMMPLFALLAFTCVVVGAEAAEDELAGRYERAAALQAFDENRLVLNQDVFPFWIEGADVFWYRQQTAEGSRFMIVDAAERESRVAFDHKALAEKLAAATGQEVEAADLPITAARWTLDPMSVTFNAVGTRWRFTTTSGELASVEGPTADLPRLLISPDRTKAVLLKDNDLWMRDLETGEERALTTDGEPYYAYADVPDATGRLAQRPEAVWSPDSSKLFTAQLDERQVAELPMIDFAPADGSVRPTASTLRAAVPGDPHIPRYRLTILDVESGEETRVHYPTIPAVRMLDTPFGGNRAWWSTDGATAYVVEIDRGELAARVVAVDAESGRTRVVFEETADSSLELGSNVYMPAAIVSLPETNELVWYSERSGWAHLYLYDLGTGELKRQLTGGDWLVRDVVAVDGARRDLFVTVAGRVKGRNPYYRAVARVDLDTGELTILSSSDADHRLHFGGEMDAMMLSVLGYDTSRLSGVSPSGRYLVETVTRADRPSRTVLRNREGEELMVVEEADASRLPHWWTWPEPVLLTAADGETTIAGLVFRPSGLSSDKAYPVIDHIYGGPQVSWVPESFGMGQYVDAASLAELGFVVVMLDGRGTTERSRAFHNASYGAVETASNLDDHVAGIRQLADRYPYIDLDRVGITGFSGGGYMTAIAMLTKPEFYSVGVAGAGNYDQRLFWHGWGERYQGMPDGDSYQRQAASTHAGKLEGELLFIHGLLDSGVHSAGLFQLIQALIDAEKDFDLVVMPQAGHELPGYAQRRQWDYFVKHLAGLRPPSPVAHESQSDLLRKKMMKAMGGAERQSTDETPPEEAPEAQAEH